MKPNKLILPLVLWNCAQLFAQDATPTATSLVLPASTVVRLRTTQSIDSKHARTGDAVALEVVRDVKVGDLLVIAKHTPVTGTLAAVHRAGRGIRRGSLVLEVKTISDITGNPIAVSGTQSAKADSKRQVEAYEYAVLSMGFFAPLLVLRGDEAEMPKGVEVYSATTQDVTLKAAALRQRMAALEVEAAATKERSRTGQATLHFYFNYLAMRHQGMPEDHVISLDGQRVVRLRQNHFFDAHVPPGHHIVTCYGHTLALEAKADEQYYVRVVKDHGWVPQLADPETAEDEMYTLQPAAAKDVYSETMVSN